MSIYAEAFNRLLEVMLPQGGYVMSLFDAFLDESYQDGLPVLVVAGYLVEVEQARQMDVAWREVLARYKVPFFHMTDVANCTNQHCHSMYRHLGAKGCDAMAREMIALIKKHVALGFAAVGSTVHFDSDFPITSDLYSFALDQCVQTICAWQLLKENNLEGSKIAFLFENGHESAPLALKLLNTRFGKDNINHKIYGGASFKEKTEVPLLQAADVLAWQARKFIADKITGARKMRGDFIELVKEKHCFSYFFTLNGGMFYEMESDPHLEKKKRDVFFTKMFEIPPGQGPGITITEIVRAPRIRITYKVDF
jgi:hypothetical protein